MLSPDPGVTKQSPYPSLWEHEVKGTDAYDRHLLTSRPLSLLIHMNHRHRLRLAHKDTLQHKYIIHRIHPPGRQPLHKALYVDKTKKKAVYGIYSAVRSQTILTLRLLDCLSLSFHFRLKKTKTFLLEKLLFGHMGKKRMFIVRVYSVVEMYNGLLTNSCKS